MSKKNKNTLGRCLIKDRSNKTRKCKRVEDNSMLHTTEVNDGYDWGRLNLQSVTAESSLQEFLSTAELADREFTAEKLNIRFMKSIVTEVPVVTKQPNFDEPLTVPRRPTWVHGVTVEEQLFREKDAFLQWRKNLNELQDRLGAALTPYERNIELWRQLWRTLEKSDIVLILLDARNPLLFRCADLEQYAKEEKCKCVLLLNKADLITEHQRKCWAKYFDGDIQIIFFSAKDSDDKVLKDIIEEVQNTELNSESESNQSESESDESDESEINSDESGIDTDEQLKSTQEDIEAFKSKIKQLDNAVSLTAEKLDKIHEGLDKIVANIRMGISIDANENNIKANNDIEIDKDNIKSNNDDIESNNDIKCELYDRTKLINFLQNINLERKIKNKLTIGLIGYPNVGKSSTVNVIMKNKKVSVSSMPGHTRHVQSLMLSSDLEILDCPGLVLPAYAVAPDLLLTAVLPIDQMRSHDAAMARLCELLPRRVFEQKYGLLLPEDTNQGHADYKQILTAHAFNRGFMTANGQPDQSRSARLILKEASAGTLQWSVLPPDSTADELENFQLPSVEDVEKKKRKPTPMEARMVEGWSSKSSEIDKIFFAQKNSAAHVKGKHLIGSMTGSIQPQNGTKPWKAEKKHANKNKKEKLRRIYSHLDEH